MPVDASQIKQRLSEVLEAKAELKGTEEVTVSTERKEKTG